MTRGHQRQGAEGLLRGRTASPSTTSTPQGRRARPSSGALKDGRILASKCPRCGEIRVPPRTYCLECYERTRIDVELLPVRPDSRTVDRPRRKGGSRARGALDPRFRVRQI